MFKDHHQNLLTQGYTVVPSTDSAFANVVRETLLNQIAKLRNTNSTSLEKLHENISSDQLNDFRVELIKYLNQNPEFKNNLLQDLQPLLQSILGPDIAVQKNVNLVISMPNDRNSQIPLHADTLTGHSMFELVIWVPFTETYKSQSMFLMPLSEWSKRKNEWNKDVQSTHELMDKWKDSFVFLEMKPFETLLFWHHLPHGNTLNEENISRISLNLRVKNLFSPYEDKGLGDYFQPLCYGPLTQLAFNEKLS